MDRRQIKTRKAILDAFSSLLEEKQYSQITVQEIIDKADIGRSTFYAHFETKDELLNAMCSDIFTHVFSTSEKELTHDFSNKAEDLISILTHTLIHLYDKRKDISRILKSQSSGIFMRYFKAQLLHTFERYESILREDIPKDFVTNLLCNSFAETVGWWICDHQDIAPDAIAAYYLKSLAGIFIEF